MVEALEPAAARVTDHALPDPLGIALDHRVGVLQALVRKKRRVIASHHHPHAAAAELGGDLVRPPRGVGLDREGGEVGGLVERDRLESLVEERGFDVRGSEAFEDGEAQRLHRVGGAGIVQVGPNERDLHAASRAVGRRCRPGGPDQASATRGAWRRRTSGRIGVAATGGERYFRRAMRARNDRAHAA
jgi:hypothetical protein